MKKSMALIFLVSILILASCRADVEQHSDTVSTETNQPNYNEPVTTTDNASAETLPVNEPEIPDEALSLVVTYMDAFKKGVNEAVKYIYFSDDWTEGVYLDTNDRLLDYRIESAEMINDDLIALTIQTRTMVSDETDVYVTVKFTIS